MGIPTVCNKWMTLPPNPDIVDIDLLYQATGGGGHRRLDLSSLEKGSVGGIVLKKTKSYDYASTESPNESLDDTDTVSLPPSHSDGNNSEVSDDSRGIDAAKLEAVGADQTRDWDEDSPGRIKKIYKTFCVIFYFKFIILEKLDLTI